MRKVLIGTSAFFAPLALVMAVLLAPAALAQMHAKGAAGALNASNATAIVSLDNAVSAACFIAAGTLAGTVVPEVSVDNGTTWVQTSFEKPESGQVVPSVVLTDPNPATTLIVYGAPGATDIRVRVSAFTSGTATATLRATQLAPPRMMFSVSAANLAAALNSGHIVEKGPRWRVTSTPAVSTQASASRAAGGAGVRHVVDCVGFSAGSTTAPALTRLLVNLRDGATGAGTIIHSWTVVIPAATGQNVAPHTVCGLGYVGSANTAMTLEFSALLTNLFQDVTISGYDVQ